ncbi:oligosaccharide flippase family protein [bacterium]|nr:oligosaccharide flippase family protein [bacterium]
MAKLNQLLARYFPPGTFLHNVVVMLFGTAFGPALNVLIMPVLARLYTPEDFGLLTLFNAFLNVLVAMPALRYEGAIPLPEDDDEASDLLVISLLLTTAFSLLILVIILTLGPWLARLFNAEELAPYLWLLPVALFANGVYRVLTMWNTRHKQFGNIARSTIARPVGNTYTAALLGFLRVGGAGLLVAAVIGQVSSATVIIYRAAGHGLWSALKLIAPGRVRELLIKHKQFPVFQLPAALLNTCSQQVSLFVMAALYDMGTVGQYGVARRIFSMPMFLIVQAVAQVFLQRAAEEFNRGGDLRRLIGNIYLRLFLVGIGPTALIFALAPWACRVFLGADFEAAGYYTRLIIPWLFIAFVGSPTTSVFAVINRQDITAIYGGASLVLRIVAIWAGWHFWQSAYWSIALYSLVGLVGNLYLMIATWILTRRGRGEVKG